MINFESLNTPGFYVTFLAVLLVSYMLRNRKLPPTLKLSLQEMYRLSVNGKMHRRFQEDSGTLGLIFRLPTLEWNPTFIVCDPTFARLILEGDASQQIPAFEKSDRIKILDRLTVNIPNIITKKTHGEGWDITRKALAPAFSNSLLYKKLPEIHRQTAEFTAIFDEHIIKNEPFEDFSQWMVRLTIGFISTTMFATEFSCLSDNQDSMSEGNIYLNQLPIAFKELVLAQGVNPFRKFIFWEKHTEAVRAATLVAKTGQDILDRYRLLHSVDEIKTDMSIIGHLIRSPYKSDAERVADVTILMSAGFDTTANQVTWIIIALSRNPEVLQKLRMELDQVFPEGPENSTGEQLSKLDYLGKVIKEGMRLYPVAAVGSSRRVPADMNYKEYVIPKGSSVVLCRYVMGKVGIHEPEEFIPERWNSDNPDADKLKELNMPFTTGRRNCIGQNLALLELKLLLATFFFSYDFKVIGEFDEVSPILKAKDLKMRVSHRKLVR